ncbi:DUF1848 domain-containing protein [bacterium]|nr:DUF1848 domain-containing protein [bacterium]
MTGPVNKDKPVLVSVSRRTDIPAFYADWFEDKLRRGEVEYRHPFNQQTYQVLLGPEHVAGFIFWSKNYAHFDRIIALVKDRGYPFYCHYTINGYDRCFEPGLPGLEQSLATFRRLSAASSADQIILRYDPIMFSADLTVPYHLQRLESILSELENKAHLCIISFVHVYKKIRFRLESLGIDLSPELQKKIDCAQAMQEIGYRYGFRVEACCCPELTLFGTNAAQCISAARLAQQVPGRTITVPRSSTRAGCQCDRCQDIGFYDTCPHGCAYCYANTNATLVERRFQQHHPHDKAQCYSERKEPIT